MSEMAQTLIRAALRAIGVIAPGETPTADEEQDGLQALKFMLRHWSDRNIRIYVTEENSVALSGAESYTIGPSGGAITTTLPAGIKRVFTKDPGGSEIDVNYRYNAGFPLGTLYVSKYLSGTLYVESWKQLTNPTVITSTVLFPPGYDEAIKWNLALRLAPEYGREPSPIVVSMALAALNDIETRNFSEQITPVRLELIKIVRQYNINYG